MYAVGDIRRLHIELSSFCNARCPSCVRNVHGADINTGYIERNLSLADIKQIFSNQPLLTQLEEVLFCGNFGDLLMNPETPDIVAWFKNHSPAVKIAAGTNGGGGTKDFWTRLGSQNIEVTFALDGLEDTHSLYRQNTLFSTVIKNAQTFIAAGGRAVWQMIVFDHNRHQVDACKKMSQRLGFADFLIKTNQRGASPVFTADGRYRHSINKFQRLDITATEFRNKKVEILTTRWAEMQEPQFHQPMEISCQAQRIKELYVNSLGEVYPCCFVGHNPHTLDPATNDSMLQVKPLLDSGQNNAIQYPLEHCIQWFDNIVSTWKHTTVSQGALLVCQTSCGKLCK